MIRTTTLSYCLKKMTKMLIELVHIVNNQNKVIKDLSLKVESLMAPKPVNNDLEIHKAKVNFGGDDDSYLSI